MPSTGVGCLYHLQTEDNGFQVCELIKAVSLEHETGLITQLVLFYTLADYGVPVCELSRVESKEQAFTKPKLELANLQGIM